MKSHVLPVRSVALGCMLALAGHPALAGGLAYQWSLDPGCSSQLLASAQTTCWKTAPGGVSGIPGTSDDADVSQSSLTPLIVAFGNNDDKLHVAYFTLGGEQAGVQMTMQGGLFQVNQTLGIGFKGVSQTALGSLSQSGGTTNAQFFTLASSGSQASSYAITGGSLAVQKDLFLGMHFQGSLGVVETTGTFTLAGTGTVTAGDVAVSSRASLQIQGGSAQMSSILFLGGADALAFTGGVLEFNTASSSIKLAAGGPANLGFGNFTGNGTPTLKFTHTTANLSGINLQVGEAGIGALHINAASTVRVANASMGKGRALFSGDGTATVAGGTLHVAGTLDVGVTGRGTMNVGSGGTVTSATGALGAALSNSGGWGRNLVNITGAGSNWTVAGGLSVGGSQTSAGQGSDLKATGGGRIQVGGPLQLWGGSTVQLLVGGTLNAGSFTGLGRLQILDSNVNFGGMTLKSGSELSMNGNSQFTVNGPVDIQGGAAIENHQLMTFNGAVEIAGGALLSGDGIKTFNAGLTLGNGPTLVVDPGTAVFGAGNVYTVELGLGSTDELVLGGTLYLGGTLKLLPWNGYHGQAGNVFTVFAASTLARGFAAVDASAFALDTGLAWDFSRLNSAGVVGIVAAPVPEPGAAWLMLGGLACLSAAWRRRSA